MKKPIETNIDRLDPEITSRAILQNILADRVKAALAAERKAGVELSWQFRHRSKSAPARICPEKKKALIRHDAFSGMEPIRKTKAKK